MRLSIFSQKHQQLLLVNPIITTVALYEIAPSPD